MKVKIYQVSHEREGGSAAMFLSLSSLDKLQMQLREDVYEKVYEEESPDGSLEDIFRKFNLAQPEDYCGRSMSVSDVVEVRNSETIESGFYFCDMVGFKKVDFDIAKVGTAPKAAPPEKTMTMAEVEQMLQEMDDIREAAITDDPFNASQKSISYWYQKWLDREV